MIGGSVVFFFEQKTAYEVLSGLVGSEKCIRGRFSLGAQRLDDRI